MNSYTFGNSSMAKKDFKIAASSERRKTRVKRSIKVVVSIAVIVFGVYLTINFLGVLGLAASGITSALATLGFGGGMVFGLMVLVSAFVLLIHLINNLIDKVVDRFID